MRPGRIVRLGATPDFHHGLLGDAGAFKSVALQPITSADGQWLSIDRSKQARAFLHGCHRRPGGHMLAFCLGFLLCAVMGPLAALAWSLAHATKSA